MSGYSQEELANSLLRIQKRKRELAGDNPNSPVASRDYREGASNYNSFAPKEMDTRIASNPFQSQVSDAIGRVSNQATAASGVQAQNQFFHNQLLEEQRRLEQAKQNRVKPTKQTIQPVKPLQVPVITPQTSVDTPATQSSIAATNPSTTPGSSYYTQTPEWLDPNAGLTTFKAGGHSWTVNASVADRFKGFIRDLVATGYKIKTAHSYADRNQANGSGNPSLHSYGLAIDINAFAAGNSYNPGNTGVHQTNLPKGISALAAKYGLVWGGDWKNSKDYMHFSVPYKGLMRGNSSQNMQAPVKPGEDYY